MKFFILFVLISFVSAANFKIYVFNVGNADSQLIVFPSGYSILIDAGEPGGTTGIAGKTGKYLQTRLQSILGNKHIHVFVLTHYHADHSGGYELGGIWYLLEKAGYTIGKFITRNIGTYTGSKLIDCKKSNFKWAWVGELGTTMKFACYANSLTEKTKLSKVRELAQICSKTQINPPDDGAEVLVVTRDAHNVQDSNGKYLARNSMNEANPVSENDFSVCLRIQYNKFVYATCGDMSGKDYVISGGTHKYHNVEKIKAKYVGEVDVLHINHHGVIDCTSSEWANTLKPTVAVASRGSGISCPAKSVMNNLVAVNTKKIYTTNTCNDVGTYSNFVKMNDDVVITVPSSGSTYTVTNSAGGKKSSFTIKSNKKAPVTCK